MKTATKEGKYVYCVITTKEPRTFSSRGIGDRGDEVYTVCFNDIAAVVSNSPITSYSISRQNLLAHEKAIEEVMKEYTVLPVRFATITEDEDKIKRILEKEYERFKDLLNKMEGKKELGIKAVFKDGIYKDILEKYDYIKMLKKKIEKLPSAKTYYERMEIGKLVEDALEKEKALCKEDILNALSPLAQDVKTNNTYGELMVTNAAFLVEKDRETEFDQKVQGLDVKYGSKINFKYVGTLPPFNFVNLVINLDEYQ